MPAGLSLKNIVKIILVLFFIFMAYLLVEKIHLAPKLSETAETELKDSETWMSIRFKGQKVGYSVQSLTNVDKGYIVDSKTYLRLKLMGQVREVRTITSARLNESLELRSFHFFISSDTVRFQLTGSLAGHILTLNSMTGGYKNTSQIRLNEIPRLTTGLMPYLAKQGLKKGLRRRVPIFDPSTLSTRWATIVVEGKEKIIIEGESVEAFRLRMDYVDMQSYAWIDLEGQTLKEEGLLGLSMIRTTPEMAQEGLTGRAELDDMVASTSAPTDRAIEKPREVRYLKARLKGIPLEGLDLDGGRQVLKGNVIEVMKEKIDVRDEVPLPITERNFMPYLGSTPFIQVGHPEIIRQARLLAGGEKSPLTIIDRVSDWIFKNLEKRPTISVPSALEVLKTKVGDCNEHAVLTVALLRAAGVPARTAVGVLYFEGRFYYHAWVEVYWGRWMAIDSLMYQVPADATHIRLVTGGLERQVELVKVIGRLEVEILEVK